jgi:hypothetical protein
MPTAKTTNPLLHHWLVCAAMLILLVTYNLICHLWGEQFRHTLEESERVALRTVFYVITIMLFPLTNVLRHVLLRLNQTMPGQTSAEQRYLITIIVTQSLLEIVSVFGLVMFLLGDDFNTLYIFSTLGLLGIFLHKPKPAEFQTIVSALSRKAD